MTQSSLLDDSFDGLRRKGRAFVWGDRIGLLIFLLSLCLFGLVWRTSFLINDSYTIANGLYAVERGSLEITTAAYGPGLETPGTNYYDGKLFSRNYGVIFAALPFVYLLRALELVADLRIALVGVWCLLVLASVLLAGRIFDRRRYANYGGSVTVLALFAGNVALATPLDPVQHHLLALQIVHMVGAAFVGVFTYRLVTELHDRRRAIMATVLVALGTPLAFWAAVPKRHVLTAAVAIGVAFAIARSRDGGRPYARASRALAYVLVGLLAWVHGPEALVVMVALVVVDVPTAPTNDIRTLGVVGGAFLVSLLPMVATNMAITGDPLTVPRSLRNVPSGADLSLDGSSGTTGGSGATDTPVGDSGGNTESAGGKAETTGGNTESRDTVTESEHTESRDTPTEATDRSTDASDGSGDSPGIVRTIILFAVALFESAIEPLSTLGRLVSDGFSRVSTRPEQIYHAFVRSGYVEGVARRANDAPAANLSLLESAPVIGGLLALVPLTVTTVRDSVEARRISGRLAAADAFVVVFVVAYSLVYVSRLPVHAQVTVRYLFPLYPLAVYGLVRIPAVGGVLTNEWRTFFWTYLGALLIGGQLLLVVLVSLALSRGEAFQFHALLALGTAAVVSVWTLSGRTKGKWGTFGASSMAVATATATTFLLFVSLEYYSLGDSHALPMVRALAELVSIA